jgi:hypothetical protein
MLQKFANDCVILQQALQTIQNQLSPISDTYGDREILEDKLKKLMVSGFDYHSMFNDNEFVLFFSLKDMKNHYRELLPALQDAEQLSSQVLTIVGQNGKQFIRREWDHVQVKSHQINTTILKVQKQTYFFFHFCRLPRSNNNYKTALQIG